MADRGTGWVLDQLRHHRAHPIESQAGQSFLATHVDLLSHTTISVTVDHTVTLAELPFDSIVLTASHRFAIQLIPGGLFAIGIFLILRVRPRSKWLNAISAKTVVLM